MNPQNVLQIGTKINIKRTDGRVHTAIVAGINYDQRSATVEWFEQGETKGKEIDMQAIESLNPEVLIRKECEDYIREPEILAPPAKLQRNPSRQSISTTLNNKATNGSIRTRIQSRPTQFYTNGILSQENAPPKEQSNVTSSRITQATQNQENIQQNVSTSRVGAGTQNVKRSNVVKEVEKLKKNREERRQRQAEEKAEKEAFLQMAPGNPHWELLNMIQDYRKSLDIKPLSDGDFIEEHTITVCVRKRPLNKKEQSRKEVDVITIPSKNQMIVHEPKNKVDLTRYLDNQLFRFDYAFNETCTNEMVYKFTAQPLVKTIFEGGFATCFAYGQTGSGKTHTMGGDFKGKTQDCQKGIYAMAAADVFRLANSARYKPLNLCVSASFFEIYSGKVFDLLNNKAKLRILEDGKQQVQVVGLTEKVVISVEEVLKFIQKGNQARTSGQTSANANSSRSHAVFQIILRANNTMTKIHGKFSLIDLAGNERGADTSSANRQTRMEGAEINKSLLALKECIRALGRQGSQHVPFRVSKLTQVLRDSFVGDKSKTCMIAMISPGVSSCEHTINTLRYADRVKELGGGDLQSNQGDNAHDEENNADLVQLQSLNKNDMTVEMLNFQQVVTELQMAEENLIEKHKLYIEWLYAAAKKAEQLLQTTDDVAYDQEEYCNSMEELMDQQGSTFGSVVSKSKELIADFKNKLAAEEQLSRKIKRK